MPFASEHKIIITVINYLRDTPSQMRRQCGNDRWQIGLAFLATKGPSHAPRLYRNRMARAGQNLSNLVLNLAWVLGRTLHHHIIIFTRKSDRSMPLQIEMLLPTNFQPARKVMRCRRNCSIRITAGHGRWRAQP